MSERIKLTEKDIIEAYYQGKQVLIIEFNQTIPYSITKQQILENQEKAEKLDSYHYEKQVDKFQQENKQLKEKLEKVKKWYEENWQGSNVDHEELKEILKHI